MADGSFPIIVSAEIAPEALPEVDVVLFAGAGGSSEGVRRALGKHPDAALNHWMDAVLVHQVNFPDAEHHCADVMETDPRTVCAGRRVRLLWLSPDCRHFSPAKGSAPVSKSIRALAWAAIPWIYHRRPRVIVLENVKAFLTWGPVIAGADGALRPDPSRQGRTFRRWRKIIEGLGGVLDYQVMSAADHGGATIRERLFVVIRFDGGPMDFPVPTHAPRKSAAGRGLKPHRGAWECIDFSRPCPSIFLSRGEAKALRVKRPLEEATLRRIAKGLFRYTIAAADPFIVGVTHAGDDRTRDVRDPLATVTGANRGEFALIAPSVIKFRAGSDGHDVRHPLATITANSFIKRPGGAAPLGLAAAYLVPRYGERDGQEPRALSVEEPMPTVVGTANGGSLVAAILDRASSGTSGADLSDPAPTLTGGYQQSLVAAFMEQANTGLVGHDVRSPVSTIVGSGSTQRLVTAQIAQMRGSNRGRGDVLDALPGLTAGGGHQALLEATLHADQPMAVPFGREEELRAFLIKYYGSATGEDLAEPLHTATSRARFGLVLVRGVVYRIVDIGMRMLDPETELARAMGLHPGFVLNRDAAGRHVTKTKITKMIGNMVHPDVAEALLRHLFRDELPEVARG